jgi:hypothetical protein
LPSESPLANTDPGPGRASAVSVAELINDWNVSSYPGFVAAKTELSGSADVGALATGGDVKPLLIGPQPPAQQVNWLNLFYSVEWVVFAGFALFIWWRLVKDDYRRDLEDTLDAESVPESGAESAGPPDSDSDADPAEESVKERAGQVPGTSEEPQPPAAEAHRTAPYPTDPRVQS